MDSIITAGKAWWYGKDKSTVVNSAEAKQAGLLSKQLEARIDKLLSQEDLDDWYRFGLEDIKDELTDADKGSLCLAQVKAWQAELGELEADYASTPVQHTPTTKQAYRGSFFKPIAQTEGVAEQPVALPAMAQRQIAA